MMSYRRTAFASLLTTIAVAVPSAAWFYAGQRQLDRELDLREKSIYYKAQKKGVNHAERLAERLEILRQAESERPFFHYQNLFHDPEGAAEGASVFPSPLAKGSPDPYIATHFQVDEDGRLTLPTINDEFPELGAQSTDSAQCALLEELRDIAYFCLGELDFRLALYRDKRVPKAEDLGTADPPPARQEIREVILPMRAWRQNLDANALYADLKYGKKSNGRPSSSWGLDENGDKTVRITVAPFLWYTLPVGEELGLVALRKVETPVGVLTQGFIISQKTVREYLAHSYYPATFTPLNEEGRLGRHDPGAGVALLHPVEGTPWGVSFDISESMREAKAELASNRDSFYLFFLIGAIGAALAGISVVTMVYQSERLALQRAQFAASAAHELRTPLAGLRLYGEMLAEGLGNPRRTKDYARRMAAEAERLGRVVTNVLSFTRLERRSLSVHPEPGDLAEAVRAALDRQKPALEDAGAEVEVELPEALPQVIFDRDAVSHIVQNLLDNAEKYTRGVPSRKIEIRLKGDAVNAVELSVADNGQGIPQEVRSRLFKPFARGKEHDDAEGLGLGLVLVKALAKVQGGDIRYQDRPSGGAEFTVTFAR